MCGVSVHGLCMSAFVPSSLFPSSSPTCNIKLLVHRWMLKLLNLWCLFQVLFFSSSLISLWGQWSRLLTDFFSHYNQVLKLFSEVRVLFASWSNSTQHTVSCSEYSIAHFIITDHCSRYAMSEFTWNNMYVISISGIFAQWMWLWKRMHWSFSYKVCLSD